MASVLPMPLSCPDCAFRMPETAAFCPGCGRSMHKPKAAVANGASQHHCDEHRCARFRSRARGRDG